MWHHGALSLLAIFVRCWPDLCYACCNFTCNHAPRGHKFIIQTLFWKVIPLQPLSNKFLLFSLKICSLEVPSHLVNHARNNTYFAKSKRRYFVISPTPLPPGQDCPGLKVWTCPGGCWELGGGMVTSKILLNHALSLCMSEDRNSCSGSPVVYQDWSSSHVLWLASKEAIIGSANLIGNSLSPLWFQNKRAPFKPALLNWAHLNKYCSK